MHINHIVKRHLKNDIRLINKSKKERIRLLTYNERYKTNREKEADEQKKNVDGKKEHQHNTLTLTSQLTSD